MAPLDSEATVSPIAPAKKIATFSLLHGRRLFVNWVAGGFKSDGSPYWMVPFANYKTMCPYLVGDHEDVAHEVTDYIARGFRTFILDEPDTKADLANAKMVFELADRAAEEAA